MFFPLRFDSEVCQTRREKADKVHTVRALHFYTALMLMIVVFRNASLCGVCFHTSRNMERTHRLQLFKGLETSTYDEKSADDLVNWLRNKRCVTK